MIACVGLSVGTAAGFLSTAGGCCWCGVTRAWIGSVSMGDSVWARADSRVRRRALCRSVSAIESLPAVLVLAAGVLSFGGFSLVAFPMVELLAN